MITRGIGRMRRIARRPGSRRERKVLILLYHRVAKLRSDPWSLAVTPGRFAEHLEVLQKHARPMRLQQLSQSFLNGNPPDRSVVVTFDDGYADNLHNAKPLLERYRIPATVFSTTGFIGDGREFWWDELDRILLQPGTLPEKLSLSINGSSYQWELGEATHYSKADYKRYRRWKAYSGARPSPRHRLYRALWELLNPLPEGEQRKVLDELLRWAGAGSAGRSTHRSLSLEEVATLARGGLIEVGAHTVTHPALSALPVASQREEIQRSKARLEEILGRPVTSFAYPYGKQEHYTAETVDIVQEAGFACACSNFAGVVEQSTDPFQLPRVVVENWKGGKFARWLSEWFDD